MTAFALDRRHVGSVAVERPLSLEKRKVIGGSLRNQFGSPNKRLKRIAMRPLSLYVRCNEEK